MSRVSSQWRLAALSLVCGFLAGCGTGADPGPERFDVSGTVSFGGQPVPRGTVVFEPDSKAGVKGPQGLAQIVDGKFDTASEGKGVVPGAHVVRINGQESGATPEATGKPLFNEFTLEVDLLKEKSSGVELAVPSSASKGLVLSSDPPP